LANAFRQLAKSPGFTAVAILALERLAYDGPGAPVHYRSDKRDGPTAGTETVDPLEFLARLVTHIPNKHQVTSTR